MDFRFFVRLPPEGGGGEGDAASPCLPIGCGPRLPMGGGPCLPMGGDRDRDRDRDLDISIVSFGGSENVIEGDGVLDG